jgi:hypothetical protein
MGPSRKSVINATTHARRAKIAERRSPCAMKNANGRTRSRRTAVSALAIEEAQAFKIDTLTGRTWGKAYLVEGTTKTVAWAAIVDYPAPKQQK